MGEFFLNPNDNLSYFDNLSFITANKYVKIYTLNK